MTKIAWGIIGCGDVTEVKSGPAFNKVKNSSLVAVMRRDIDKVKEYAKKNKVSTYYNNADFLINDPNVNAIYIATPPSSHEQYAMAAISAGKNIYLEKPMALNYAAANRIAEAAVKKSVKVSVAHYRRQQPIFKKIKEILDKKEIGEVLSVSLSFYRKPPSAEELKTPGMQWRLNPAISGGGLFHDLAPHQLDLLYYFFGDIQTAYCKALNQSELYPAPDLIAGEILFNSGVLVNGVWNFTAMESDQKDVLEIFGTRGTLRFSVFQHEIFYQTTKNSFKTYTYDRIEHVQQPMIEKVVDYFLGNGANPCSENDGVVIMNLMDILTQSKG